MWTSSWPSSVTTKVKSLLALLAILMIAGCDDEIVQDKIADVLEHGSVVAQIECTYTTSNPFAPLSQSGGMGTYLRYKATKMIDGSCFVQAHLGAPPPLSFRPPSATSLYAEVLERSDARSATCESILPYVDAERSGLEPSSDTPYRPGVDGFHVRVEDGNLVGYVRDNDLNSVYVYCPPAPYTTGPCADPWPLFSVSAATYCTGRNLEAFGVE